MNTSFNHDVFISYTSADSSTVHQMCKELEENGIKCWIAPRDVIAGEDYANLIEKAIIHSKIFLIVCSKSSMQSRWVTGELNIAFNEGKRIVPVSIDKAALEGSFRLMLNQLHIIPYGKSFLHDISAILGTDVLKTPKKTSRKKSAIIIASTLVLAGIFSFLALRPETVTDNTPIISETDTTITISVGEHTLKMIAIEAGSFLMGTNNSNEQDPKPMHKVTISRKFYLAETEVTQGFWKAIMEELPCEFSGDIKPIEGCSWNECQVFIRRLSSLCGKTFRLPTEAEWEYAAKEGIYGSGFSFSGSDTIDEVAWHMWNSEKKIHDVKGKAPNRLGLYDMSGNVEEWCEDWYGIYSPEDQTDPIRSEIQKTEWNYRVLRGGSYLTDDSSCLTTYRSCNHPVTDERGKNGNNLNYSGIGLRLAMTAE